MAKVKRYFYKRSRYPLYRRLRYHRKFGSKYFELKADYTFTVWKTNNEQGNAGLGFRFHSKTLAQDISHLFLYQLLSSEWGDYAVYKNLFNEMKILGLRVVAIPNAQNQVNSVDYQGDPVYFGINFVHPITESELINSNNMIYLNPFQQTIKYFRNQDKSYFTTDITNVVASNPSELRGEIRCGPDPQTLIQSKSPSWVLKLTFYIRFRKSKAN